LRIGFSARLVAERLTSRETAVPERPLDRGSGLPPAHEVVIDASDAGREDVVAVGRS
jgi:hypothetical protein